MRLYMLDLMQMERQLEVKLPSTCIAYPNILILG